MKHFSHELDSSLLPSEIPVGTEPVIATLCADEDQGTLIDLGPYPDPFITLSPTGSYIFIFVDDTKRKILAKEADDIHALPSAQAQVIWEHPSDFTEIWAPELHFQHGKKFIHYAADKGDGVVYVSHIAIGDECSPLDEFESYDVLNLPGETFAIDLTRTTINDKTYFAWSGWEGNENLAQNIYMAEVDESGKVFERHVVSRPEFHWEKAGTAPNVPDGINEGPQFFKRYKELPDAGNLWRLDSAGASWTDHYCLALSCYMGGDPLLAESWKKMPEPAFYSTDNVFGPGHACTIQSKDDRWWLVYHKARHSGAGWDRVACAQEFTWDEDGVPNFGSPLSPTPIGSVALLHMTS